MVTEHLRLPRLKDGGVEPSETTMITECGFCDQVLDEDEELVPVFVGDPPKPQPQELEGFAKRSSSGGYLWRGIPAVELGAVYKGLLDADNVKVDRHRRVERAEFEGGASLHVRGEAPYSAASVSVDRSVAGATIRIEPEFEEPEPDLMVCEHCEEMFKNE